MAESDFRSEVLRMHEENKESVRELAKKVDGMKDAIYAETSAMKVNIAMLQVKSGVWGVVGGGVVLLLAKAFK